MSYTLDLQSEFPDAVRATAREELEGGAAVLTEQRADDPVGAVHEARKHVKKSRSLLRLARPGLDRRTYRHENRTLRDAARTVSDVRDADVLVETVEALHERFAGQLPARAFEKLRKQLAEEAEQGRAGLDASLGAELEDTLRTVASRVDEWRLDGAGWSVAGKGIDRAYRRGRKTFAVAHADPSTENLHEWRKRVKDLWYHERLLTPAWPAVVGAQADEAHALSDLLGDDHDLAVLAERLSEQAPTEDTDAILELIDQRRAELLAHARALGRRVYAEKPKAFTRRIARYFRSAEVADPVPG
jgi:CHAD domain-containing protein